METIFSFFLTDIHCNFLLETNLQRKSGRNGNVSTLLILQQYYNAFEMVQKRSTCNEINDSLQRIETGCETFREKRYNNGIATVLQWYPE
jgi:hypothetical protein